jgi:hypothetical protein
VGKWQFPIFLRPKTDVGPRPDPAERPGLAKYVRFPPRFWKWFHWTCAIVMGLALIWIVVTLSVGWPPRSLLIGEWVSAWAFGASFLAKGAEWDMLLGKPNPPTVTPTLEDDRPR